MINYLVEKRGLIALFLFVTFYSSICVPLYGARLTNYDYLQRKGDLGVINFNHSGPIFSGSNNRFSDSSNLLNTSAFATDNNRAENYLIRDSAIDDIDGPSQPEMKSFQPVGADKLVDLFTGNFSYSIPLLDVGGYPVNLFYNGDVGAEQDASWVGFGWNINPGAISRDVRGVPDDFKGDEMEQLQQMKPNITYGGGAGSSFEIFGIKGVLDVSTGANLDISINNYLGPAIGLGFDPSIKLTNLNVSEKMAANAGIQFGLSSKEGVNMGANLGVQYMETMGKSSIQSGLGASTSYNSRAGIRGLELNMNVNSSIHVSSHRFGNYRPGGTLMSESISFLRPTYSPSLRFPFTSKNYTGRFEYGSAIFGLKRGLAINGYYQKSYISKEDQKQVKPVYGTMYLHEGAGSGNAVLDFTRENDQEVTPETPVIAAPQYTYDVFSIKGEGTGGSIRFYRDDLATVHDPKVTSKDQSLSFGVDFNPTTDPYIGGEVGAVKVTSTAEAWKEGNQLNPAIGFKPNDGLKQFGYFRSPGEMGVVNQSYLDAVGGINLVSFQLAGNAQHPKVNPALHIIDDAIGTRINSVKNLSNIGSTLTRAGRSQVVSVLTVGESRLTGIDKTTYLYHTAVPVSTGTTEPKLLQRKQLQREGNYARDWHVGEINVLESSGQRYVYGLPLYNTMQKDFSFSVSNQELSGMADKVVFTSNEADINGSPHLDEKSKTNKDGFTHISSTPPYAHSFLLTGLLSPDYVDVTGDGITEDDLGTAVKFNYGHPKSDADGKPALHYWRSPHVFADKGLAIPNVANLNKGLNASDKDDKAMVSIGAREVVYLHSIESKSFIAIFKVLNDRKDGRGFSGNEADLIMGKADNPANGGTKVRLEEINLYSKADVQKSGLDKARPVKTVHFQYDYSLCKGTPDNLDASDNGKLTLRSVWFSYNGMKNRVHKSSYVFSYGDNSADEASSADGSTNNPVYSMRDVDRWGTYKKASQNLPGAAEGISNSDYPYALQDASFANNNAAKWMLKRILLPSGGQIEVDYESDTYNYVADKAAASMFEIIGMGEWNPASNKVVNAGRNLYSFANLNGFDYVIVKVPPIGNHLSAYKFIEGMKQIYCRLYVKMPNGKHEWLEVYAEPETQVTPGRENVGFMNTVQRNEIFIRLKNIEGHSAISFSAVSFLRERLPALAFPGYDNQQGSNIEGLLRAIPKMISRFKELSGPITYVKSEMWARVFAERKAFARLNVVNGVKYGGGYRVKEVRMKDNFRKMTEGGSGSQFGAVYGQRYIYEERDENGKPLFSYGVASYEPLMGNEENPWAEAITHNQKLPLGPAMYGAVENPVLAGLFNAPLVGYSKVIVESIKRNPAAGPKPKSGTGRQVTEFFTAKDFPPVYRYTVLDGNHQRYWNAQSISPFFWKYQYDRRTLSQGFLVVLNDMHGKMKSQAMYAEGNMETPVTRTRYEYINTGKNGLNDKVNFVYGDEGGIIRQGNLGVDVEVMSDTRQFSTKSKSWKVQGQLVVAWKFPPIPLPIFLPTGGETEQTYRSIAVTKVVNYHSLVSRTIVEDKGSVVSTQDLLYDAKTGHPVVSSTHNAFGRPFYFVKIPAWWAYPGMGPASANIDGIFRGVNFFNGRIDAGLTSQQVAQIFKNGDELLVMEPGNAPSIPCEANSYTSGDIRKVWAFDRRWENEAFNGFAQGSPDIVFMDERGRFYNRSNVTVRIVRSGMRNMIAQASGEIALMSNPVRLVNGVNYLVLSGDTLNVLNATAITYSDRWQVSESVMRKTIMKTSTTGGVIPCSMVKEEISCDGNALESSVNPFVKGLIGTYRPVASYALEANRTNADGTLPTNVARDGFIDMGTGPLNTFNFFWNIIRESKQVLPTMESTGWVQAETSTKFNKAGLQLETRNALGIYQSADYGNGNIIPAFVAANAPANEVVYETFEEQVADASLNPLSNQVCNKKELRLSFTGASVEGSGANPKHSGQKALWVNAGGYAVSDEVKVGTYRNNSFAMQVGQRSVGRLLNQGANFIAVDPAPAIPDPLGPNDFSITTLNDGGGVKFVIDPLSYLFSHGSTWETYDGSPTQIRFESYVDICQDGVYQYKLNARAPESLLFLEAPCSADGDRFRGTSKIWLHRTSNIYSNWNGINGSIPGNAVTLQITSNAGVNEYLMGICLKKGRYRVEHVIRMEEYLFQESPAECTFIRPSIIDQYRNYYSNSPVYSFSFSPLDFTLFKNTQSQSAFNELIPIQWNDNMFLQQTTLQPQKPYFFSAWVKADCASPCSTYENMVNVQVKNAATFGSSDAAMVTWKPTGPIVEGWQKIEGSFTTPANIQGIRLVVQNQTGGAVWIDDLRMHPFNASVKGYVYDARNLRLMAELSDNNFATFYEYDEEGVLTRTKVETERGIKTITETRSSTQKAITELQ
jgi:hypothetical protein